MKKFIRHLGIVTGFFLYFHPGFAQVKPNIVGGTNGNISKYLIRHLSI